MWVERWSQHGVIIAINVGYNRAWKWRYQTFYCQWFSKIWLLLRGTLLVVKHKYVNHDHSLLNKFEKKLLCMYDVPYFQKQPPQRCSAKKMFSNTDVSWEFFLRKLFKKTPFYRTPPVAGSVLKKCHLTEYQYSGKMLTVANM